MTASQRKSSSETASTSSCLNRVFLTFFFTVAPIFILGAALGSRVFNYRGPGCRVSDNFPSQVLRWCDAITRNAEENGFSPDLIAALIWHESGGNPKAYSVDGAVGLMQVMPRDGKAANFQCPKGACFEGRPTIAQLQNPDFNIRYGTQLLRQYQQQYNGDLREGLKAYGPLKSGYSYADRILAVYQQYGDR
jgi:soluble lytic murein transglycosylase-like protein